MESGTAINERRLMVRTWYFVWGLALLFLAYGLFMFFVVGDRGPANWDFNVVEDIPGKSIYSTYPQPAGATVEPQEQHVSGRPAQAPDVPGRRGE